MSAGSRARSDRRLLGQVGQARAMTMVTAVMLFLTVLAAALGLATRQASARLGDQIAGRLTVQLPVAGDRAGPDMAARLRRLPGVRDARAVSRVELTALVEPWLGDAANDPDLPMPAMVDVDLASADRAVADRVAAQVHATTADARVERHATWMAPLTRLLHSFVALAGLVVLLMASATAAVVILAAKSGLDSHRDTIQVLHMLGSTDVQVARLFQRRIAFDALVGGIVGTLLAAAVLVALGSEVSRLDAALVSGVALTPIDWLVLAALPLGFALLALVAARLTITRALRRVL